MTQQATHPAVSAAAIEAAVRRLLDGGLVAFPTETVYGLGADAENDRAVAGIYAAKGRPSNHPVIVHIAPEGDPAYWAAEVPHEARLLMQAFWPGPLTLILKRAAHVGSAVTGGQDSVGLRCPSHPVAQELLRAFARARPNGQGGLAGPSANKFGQVSPTRAEHVRAEFPDEVSKGMPVLDGGASEVGIESTIIDLSRLDQGVGAVLLRPGHISAAQIAAVLGAPVAQPDRAAPRASGTLKAHYAPHTPLELVDAARMQQALRGVGLPAGRVALVAYAGQPASAPGAGATDQLHWHAVPDDPARYAQALYATLRELDGQGYARILLQAPPRAPEWDAVNDRIGRAAAAFSLDTTGLA
ncbi:L-threonylcarbamoyladenylate synthase [Bordetella genomosp. 13]|uniref:Threonylcarbamoyl-AMP synthase n=1 Tax=Bordetella genomosp. 13 TaxID=463040 RepID=A0A1W6ZD60_9BORD|nr:L-threonylcarbamoyladenylate synthase [Bordetella genomosp. 13]ARP95328.1 threonylcarbamoyl-AMP synthase [Bordetella genomosp. 13]